MPPKPTPPTFDNWPCDGPGCDPDELANDGTGDYRLHFIPGRGWLLSGPFLECTATGNPLTFSDEPELLRFLEVPSEEAAATLKLYRQTTARTGDHCLVFKEAQCLMSYLDADSTAVDRLRRVS